MNKHIVMIVSRASIVSLLGRRFARLVQSAKQALFLLLHQSLIVEHALKESMQANWQLKYVLSARRGGTLLISDLRTAFYAPVESMAKSQVACIAASVSRVNLENLVTQLDSTFLATLVMRVNQRLHLDTTFALNALLERSQEQRILCFVLAAS